MYLPAIAVAAPILISGIYLSQVYPIYAREIEIFCVGVVALAGFLQWYLDCMVAGRTDGVSIGFREPCIQQTEANYEFSGDSYRSVPRSSWSVHSL
jgi:hypothetical protein